jgi:hypothetical protein
VTSSFGGTRGGERWRERDCVDRSGDVYEPDDDDDLATEVSLGCPQTHTIYPDEDKDWLVLSAPQVGCYLVHFRNVTVPLKGEIRFRQAGEKEKRLTRFEIGRGGGLVRAKAPFGTRYIKIKVEAEDDDDTGSYDLVVHRGTHHVPESPTHLHFHRFDRDREPTISGRDEYEPDGRSERAGRILVGTSQWHTVYPDEDQDWLVFPARPGGTYVVGFTGVTVPLKGEVRARVTGKKGERRLYRFEMGRAGGALHLTAPQGAQYITIKVEAEDDDDTGSYRVSLERQ